MGDLWFVGMIVYTQLLSTVNQAVYWNVARGFGKRGNMISFIDWTRAFRDDLFLHSVQLGFFVMILRRCNCKKTQTRNNKRS